MKPLVLWARDKHPVPYALRIREHRDGRVQGAVKIDGVWQPFSFDERTLELRIGAGDEVRVVTIDEWGWER